MISGQETASVGESKGLARRPCGVSLSGKPDCSAQQLMDS